MYCINTVLSWHSPHLGLLYCCSQRWMKKYWLLEKIRGCLGLLCSSTSFAWRNIVHAAILLLSREIAVRWEAQEKFWPRRREHKGDPPRREGVCRQGELTGHEDPPGGELARHKDPLTWISAKGVARVAQSLLLMNSKFIWFQATAKLQTPPHPQNVACSHNADKQQPQTRLYCCYALETNMYNIIFQNAYINFLLIYY